MTEDEAKTKWCPFAIGIVGSITSVKGPEAIAMGNRNENGEPSVRAKCIGSACMAWRWGSERVEQRDIYRRGTGKFKTEISKTEGHCGLAGGP